jgi:hypothetical protein
VSPDEAMDVLNTTLAHAWMVRTFLKHADEIQDDEEMLEVPRMIFDYIRALEPSFERKDAAEYLHRARGKLPKLRKVAERLAAEHKRVSDHTNYQMAAVSLSACVRRIEEVLAAVNTAKSGPAAEMNAE